jgi:hypothetical protein
VVGRHDHAGVSGGALVNPNRNQNPNLRSLTVMSESAATAAATAAAPASEAYAVEEAAANPANAAEEARCQGARA